MGSMTPIGPASYDDTIVVKIFQSRALNLFSVYNCCNYVLQQLLFLTKSQIYSKNLQRTTITLVHFGHTTVCTKHAKNGRILP